MADLSIVKVVPTLAPVPETLTLQGIRDFLAREGHGHVVPAQIKARCGGPALCHRCQEEKELLEYYEKMS